MYGTRNKSPADAEVIEVLTAISQVSARLAWKLSILAASQFEEVILSRLVDTFSSRILYPMLPLARNHSITAV